MSLSKARDRERKQLERGDKHQSRLEIQLRVTPEIANYLESKAGEKTVEDYLLGQLERAARVGSPT